MVTKLPKIKHPTYYDHIPSTYETVKYRPFVTKEEKLILMAKMTEDVQDAIGAMKQVLQNCVLEPEDFDVGKLTTFDIEYLFLRLRSKSVGEMIELKYEEDGVTYSANVNLPEVHVVETPGHTNIIPIANEGNIGLKMRYPDFDQLLKMSDIDLTAQKDDYDLIVSCVECVFDGDEVSTWEDFNEEELKEFIGELPLEALEKIVGFFNTSPKLQHTVTFVSPEGEEKEIVLKGLADFFI